MANMGSLQEVIDWGLIGWKYYASVIGPIQCEGLANVEVTQIACAEKRFLILSHNGRVHTQAYNSDTLAPQLVQGLASRNTVKIAAHSASHHCVALAAAGQVYSWALGTEDGLAMGTLPLEEPKLISAFSGKQAGKHGVHIACRSTYSAAITAEGELYPWGCGNYGRLGHGKKVIDVAASSTHCLTLTEDSQVHSSGSNDQCQHFDTLRVTKPEPAALPGLHTKHTVGIACGPAQVWAASS
ncbi:PREDICTED: E3 ubiquitin-protein ligase HERC2-like isoform X2 [Cercocebus atys]|uniref:E3 ubiquitin-protein ligase HERC2-like isoform X2 n=1 Tax=Cercocebus atys TaxID=9531 RepID=UPI0005F565E8|nr:PREDICTED: E3 ubiquitin-protein ligase HERC2-like isoform X2 [Cercocebus atys]